MCHLLIKQTLLFRLSAIRDIVFIIKFDNVHSEVTKLAAPFLQTINEFG